MKERRPTYKRERRKKGTKRGNNNRQAGSQAVFKVGRQAERRTDRQTGTQTCVLTGRLVNRQRGREKVKRKGRKGNGQLGRQSDRRGEGKNVRMELVAFVPACVAGSPISPGSCRLILGGVSGTRRLYSAKIFARVTLRPLVILVRPSRAEP